MLSLLLPPEASRAAFVGCVQHLSRCWCQSADRKTDKAVPVVNSVTSPTCSPSPRPVLLPPLCPSNKAPCLPPLCHLSPGPSNLHPIVLFLPVLPHFLYMTDSILFKNADLILLLSCLHTCFGFSSLWNKGYGMNTHQNQPYFQALCHIELYLSSHRRASCRIRPPCLNFLLCEVPGAPPPVVRAASPLPITR